jgi:transcription antitermination factor NusG
MSLGPWHVLHVIANHEKKVAQHLAARSLEHYLPLYCERSQRTDRPIILELPLFRGYVFVRFSPQNRLSVISTPGVLRLLGDGRNNTINHEEIERIRDGLANGYLLRPHPQVTVGTPVRVRGGIFDGVVGVVTALRHRCKVVIALAAIKQCFSLEIDCSEVEILINGTTDSEIE